MSLDTLLDEAAAQLVATLTELVEALERMESWQWGNKPPPRESVGPACIDSHLDFVTRPEGDYEVPITAAYSRTHRNQFTDQLVVCRTCGVRVECLEWSKKEGGERYGIWGGLLPHER